MSRNHRFALVLAAGDGTRLRSLTVDASGAVVPKQFCGVSRRRSLFAQALRRAADLVAEENVVPVVAARHRAWWSRDLAVWPAVRPVVQPRNRGTAAGLLLPLLAILERDPAAVVYVLPSDHFVADERALRTVVDGAFELARVDRERLLLLGITPDAPDEQYGWIVPGAETAPGLFEVRAFVEKPDPRVAQVLMRKGAIWNSFLIVAAGTALLRVIERANPTLVGGLRAAATDPAALERVYETLEPCDFSRQVLEGAVADLRLLPVPECGWSDLGTPDRVVHCARRMGPRPPRRSPAPWPAVDLLAAAAAHVGS